MRSRAFMRNIRTSRVGALLAEDSRRTMLTIHKRDWLLLRGRLRAHAALKVLPCFAACSFVDATSATAEEGTSSANVE